MWQVATAASKAIDLALEATGMSFECSEPMKLSVGSALVGILPARARWAKDRDAFHEDKAFSGHAE